MAWEWVAPVAAGGAGALGAFFTWLTGTQSRKHLTDLASATDRRERAERIEQERRDAYLAVLALAHVNKFREKYERRGDEKKLADVERLWPRSVRVKMLIELDSRFELYGSVEACRLVDQWTETEDPHDPQAYNEFRLSFLEVARRDLGLPLQ